MQSTVIETPFGPMHATFTSGTSAYIDANSDGKFITINGLRVCAVVRLEKRNGEWVDSGWCYFNKKDWKNTRDMDLTASQNRKARTVLIPFLCEWAASQDSSQLDQAEIDSQQGTINVLNYEIKKLQDQLTEKMNARAEAQALLDAARARLNATA